MKVWALYLDFDYDAMQRVFSNEEAALSFLYEYVCEYWLNEMPDAEFVPADKAEAIELYFSDNEDEEYRLEELTVLDTYPSEEIST